ncbi:AfsR/SARP family transcriptional regulator [Streptomyces hirsutus]|uniref:AfsR/SARP family transcriptional regulator n=1 Tax=Streptomyces hirsutus TaxID=35620 RepID=UPI001F0A707A|nr:BTAD domain-containing putative transcriptional regulator [Streptomyces hirsutus]
MVGDPQSVARVGRRVDVQPEVPVAVQEVRTRMLIGEGRPPQAVVAADGLVGRDPLRETSWVILLRALCAAGRGAEALRRYETVRRTPAARLRRDLGLASGY